MGRVCNIHPHVFKNTKVQSEALIGFSAALSGDPAKTSSILESSISVDTPLVNTHSRDLLQLLCIFWTFLFIIIKTLVQGGMILRFF